MPPAAKTLFIKRVLDSQKFFIKRIFVAFFLRALRVLRGLQNLAVDLGGSFPGSLFLLLFFSQEYGRDSG